MTEDIYDIAKRQHHLLEKIDTLLGDLLDENSTTLFMYCYDMKKAVEYLLNKYDENYNYEGKEND